MPTRVLRHPAHIDALARMLSVARLPITVSWAQGATRSAAQNRLSHRWYADIARQLGDRTADEARAECKLAWGVPILLAEHADFAASWAQTFAPLPYAARLRAVQTFDLPVTRLMTVPQMTAYLDAVQRHWTAAGVRLTDPEALKYEEEFQ
jgi:hypothetical protein